MDNLNIIEMNIKKILQNKGLINQYYKNYVKRKLLVESKDFENLKIAHIKKAEHNMAFVNTIADKEEFKDWVIISLYYTLYHCFLSLVENKSFTSKNHNATLVFILKNYVEINYNDLQLFKKLQINESDAKFYLNLKYKRTQANYSTNFNFENENIENLIFEVKLILLKVKEIIEI